MDSDDLNEPSSPLTTIPDSPRSSISGSSLSSAPDSINLKPPPGWRDLTPPPSHNDDEDMPPARKRRKIEPKTRTTQYLDLMSETAQSEYDREQALEELLRALRKRQKIVVVAGAGISVSAGIPDFRSSHGLFKTLRGEHKLKGSGKQLFDASVYKDDSSTAHFHDMVRQLSRMSADAAPTLFHRLIARLSTEGRLLRLYTQNVDGLETSLPPLATSVPLAHKGPWPQTIQLHGGLEKMTCQKCRQISDFEAKLFDGPVPPQCPQCVESDNARTNLAGKRSHGIGRMRPRIVLYNEHNPDDEAIGAVSAADCRTRPDAVVVVGTSMKIPGVRRIVSQMCRIVRDRREGTTIWINRDGVPTGKDLEDCWDLVVKGDSDDVARLVNLREWDEPLSDVGEEYTDSDVEKVKASQGELKVIVPSPEKKHNAADLVRQKFAMSKLTPPRSQNGDIEKQPASKITGPIKIRLIIPSKLSTEVKPAPTIAKLMENPASGGRKLSEVLNNKENKGKTNKPKIASNKKKSMAKLSEARNPGQSIIMGKVTKSKPETIKVKAASKKEPLSPRKESNLNTDHQISEAVAPSSTEPSPGPETPPMICTDSPILGDKTPQTISPNGKVPPDMVRLLNY